MTASIEAAVAAYALGSSAVAAIIVNRWGPHSQSQLMARPYVVYTRISTDHERHLRGASGLAFCRIQLDLHGNDYRVLQTLAEAIRMRVDGYRGSVTVGSDTVVIQQIAIVDHADGYDTPIDGSDTGVHSIRMDIRVSALEPVPTLS